MRSFGSHLPHPHRYPSLGCPPHARLAWVWYPGVALDAFIKGHGDCREKVALAPCVEAEGCLSA